MPSRALASGPNPGRAERSFLRITVLNWVKDERFKGKTIPQFCSKVSKGVFTEMLSALGG